MSFVFTQPFIVVGALVVRDGKILLVKENHLPDKGKWNFPAGKLDYGESPADAVAREVYEEAGLNFTPSAILGLHSVHRTDVPGAISETHVLRIVYLGEVTGDASNANGEVDNGELEIADYRWLVPDELLALDDSSLRYHDIKEYVRDYLANKSYPLDLISHMVQGTVKG